MAKAKRTTLPTPTAEDLAQRPDMLRKTATGHAWKCAYCGKFASSETQAGKYVCKDHGGSTPQQRDPVARAQAEAEGKPAPRPPGRPLKTGVYSKSPGVRIDELVQRYQEQQLDPDVTDEDMLYLRAYLEEMKALRPDVEQVRRPLDTIVTDLEAFQTCIVPDENVSVDSIIDMLERGQDLTALARALSVLLKQLTTYTKDLEGRHARLIAMSKLRAETRLKNAAAAQMDVFTVLLRRLMRLLSEQLTPNDYEALEQRIARDLAEVPAALVTGERSVEA